MWFLPRSPHTYTPKLKPPESTPGAPRLLPQALAPLPGAPRFFPQARLHPQQHPVSSLQNPRLTPLHKGCGCVTLIKMQGGPALSLSPPTQRLDGWQGHQGSWPHGRWGARENCGCVYRLRVRLLDVYENEVVKFSASPNPVLQWTERGCRQVGPDCFPGHPDLKGTPNPSSCSDFLPSSHHHWIFIVTANNR